MAYALADENEAIAVESRQEAEACKLYVEQKEEEVKILENFVEELEGKVNVMEKKVYEMNEQVERHRLIRESLEVEIQALRQRLLTVENFTDAVDSENRSSVIKEDALSRHLQNKLLELHDEIKHLERDVAPKDDEIKQCKDYISELLLHSEAQASQFQDKYRTLEAMFHEVKTDMSSSSFATVTVDRSDKSSVRTRGSSSPFKCISSLVQQMNLEKDQELSVARLQIEELESTLSSRQKVCMLNARLTTAESMTQDVIRNLLDVKHDMTNYVDLIDQHQVQKLLETTQQQTEEFCLKKDKSNLIRRVAELDEMIKSLLKTGSTWDSQIQKMSKTKACLGSILIVLMTDNLDMDYNKFSMIFIG